MLRPVVQRRGIKIGAVGRIPKLIEKKLLVPDGRLEKRLKTIQKAKKTDAA